MKLDSNNHSVFLFYFHLVLVVKDRRNVFDDELSDYAKEMFVRLSANGLYARIANAVIGSNWPV